MATDCVGLPPGLVMANNALPPGMLVVKNILDPETCDRLVRFAAGEKAVASTVEDLSQAAGQKYVSRQSTAVLLNTSISTACETKYLLWSASFFLTG